MVETKNQYLLCRHVTSRPEDLTTREQETMVPNYLYYAGNATHLEMFPVAAWSASFNIPMLSLHNMFEIFTKMLPPSVDVARGLKTLILDTSLVPGDLQNVDVDWTLYLLSQWAAGTSNLDDLTMIQDPHLDPHALLLPDMT